MPVCEVCFYSAWVPVPTEPECALRHPHEGEHIRCDYCWLAEAFRRLQERVERLERTT